MKENIESFINLESKLSIVSSIIAAFIGIIGLLLTFSSGNKNYQLEALRNQPVFTVRYGDLHLSENRIQKNLIISAKHSEVDNLSVEALAAAKYVSTKTKKIILVPIIDYYLPCTIRRDFSKNDIGFCDGNKNYKYAKSLKNLFEELEFQSVENFIKIICKMKDETTCDTFVRHNNTGDIRDSIAKNTFTLLHHLIQKNIIIQNGVDSNKLEQNIILEFRL